MEQIAIKKDLIKILLIYSFFVILLVALKMYDLKTNEIGKLGNMLMNKLGI